MHRLNPTITVTVRLATGTGLRLGLVGLGTIMTSISQVFTAITFFPIPAAIIAIRYKNTSLAVTLLACLGLGLGSFPILTSYTRLTLTTLARIALCLA